MTHIKVNRILDLQSDFRGANVKDHHPRIDTIDDYWAADVQDPVNPRKMVNVCTLQIGSSLWVILETADDFTRRLTSLTGSCC